MGETQYTISPKHISACLGGLVIAMLWCDAVMAANGWRYGGSDRQSTVVNRPRPDYDPAGIPAGGLRLYPAVGIQANHDDNVFATEADTTNDQIIEVRPSLELRSDWNRHRLKLRADAALGRYVDFESEDYDDYSIGINGRIDATRDNFVLGDAFYARRHEDRSSPDDARGVEPTVYFDRKATAAYHHKLNRYSVRLNGSFQQLEFDDVQILVPTGLRTIDNSDRDRDVVEGSIQFGYEIVPQYEAFLRGSVNSVSYDNEPDRSGFFRNTDGYELTAGAAVDIPGVSFGEFFAGYLSQEFDDPRFETVDKIAFGGSLTWNVTQLTTLETSLSRRSQATTQAGASTYLDTRWRLNIDHELLRNLLLNAGAYYADQDYKGIPRQDDVFGIRLGSRYLLNRNLYASLSYGFDKRNSNLEGSSFERNILRLGIELQK